MYHFTFIDETSTDPEVIPSEPQEKASKMPINKISKSRKFMKRTSHLLYKYLDQPNCVRIFISKN